MERKDSKLREKRLRTSSSRRKGDSSNGFLLEQIEEFKVGGMFHSPILFFFLAFFANCGAWSQATSQLLIFCSAMQSTVFKRSNLMFYILHLVNFSYSLIIFYYFQLTWLITFICVSITVAGLHVNVGCQEQKHFFPLRTKLCYHANFSKNRCTVYVLTTNGLSLGCKPRI